MPDELTTVRVLIAVVAGLYTIVLAMLGHAVKNWTRRVEGAESQLADMLPRMVRTEQSIQAIDQTVQSLKATVSALQGEQHQWAIAVARLEALATLPGEVRQVRDALQEQATQLAKIEVQLKRGSSGQHRAR